MSMSRKDFEMIAHHLRVELEAQEEPDGQLGVLNATSAVASALAQLAPRFDRQRFLAASGFYRPEAVGR